jgi:D-alanine-D-alanine ligase
MRVAVCYNQTPNKPSQGEARDLIADAGSFDEAKAVQKALTSLGHQAELVPLADDLADFIVRIKAFAPATIFNLCEGFWGNARQEMHVAGVFELLRIPFTGSNALCLGLSQDKIKTKALLQQSGLPTPAFAIAKQKGDALRLEKLKFPLIVKPPYEDASQGIEPASVVDNKQALAKRIRYIHEVYRQPALVEEFIEGRELNVAILGGIKPKILPISEITFDPSLPRAMVCFDSKWSPESAAYRGTKPVCPAVLSSKETLLVYTVAERAFRLLGCRDYARVDIRLRDNTPYILEINANPDISPDAGLARSAATEGLRYSQLIERILAFVSQRKEVADARP